MKLYYLANKNNGRKIGYEYGLDVYNKQISDFIKNVDIEALRMICENADDMDFFRDFLAGMNSVFKMSEEFK